MALIPEIRKYYSFNGIKVVGELERLKRPWLSIITHLLHLCEFKMRMVTVAFALVNRPRMGDLIVQRCKIHL